MSHRTSPVSLPGKTQEVWGNEVWGFNFPPPPLITKDMGSAYKGGAMFMAY